MPEFFHKTSVAMRRLCAVLLLAAATQSGATTLNVYNTYLYPPFHNSDDSGLAADLVALLERRMGGTQLKLTHLPRRRLLTMLDDEARPFNGLALFLNPVFIGPRRAARVDWSEILFHDYNVLVYRGEPVSAQQLAEGKKGRRFGGVRGNIYRVWDPLVERGILVRDDGGDLWGNLRKLKAGRIDFTQMNQLTYEALIARSPELGGLTTALEQGDGNQRCILISRRIAQPVAQRLMQALRELADDPEWRALMARYQVHPGASAGARTSAPGQQRPAPP